MQTLFNYANFFANICSINFIITIMTFQVYAQRRTTTNNIRKTGY